VKNGETLKKKGGERGTGKVIGATMMTSARTILTEKLNEDGAKRRTKKKIKRGKSNRNTAQRPKGVGP